MSGSDAITQGQDLSQTEDQLQDRIIADAIGYARGLVSVLDSLTEGFRRRGRELEDQKQRLAILQNERRAVLEERAGLEAHLRSTTTERDALPDRLGEIMAERQALARQLQESGSKRQRLQDELAGSVARAEQAQEEAHHLSERVNALMAELDAQPTAAVRLRGAPTANPEHRSESATPLTSPPTQTAETAPEGQPSRINEMGMVVPFDTCLTIGRVLTVRLIRGGEEHSVRGSVVRAQPPKGAAGGPPALTT